MWTVNGTEPESLPVISHLPISHRLRFRSHQLFAFLSGPWHQPCVGIRQALTDSECEVQAHIHAIRYHIPFATG